MEDRRTVGAVTASRRELEIRNEIEALLVRFQDVVSPRIVADELWNSIVGPVLDARGGETEWGYRRKGEPDEFVRSAATEEVARNVVQLTGHPGDEWVAV